MTVSYCQDTINTNKNGMYKTEYLNVTHYLKKRLTSKAQGRGLNRSKNNIFDFVKHTKINLNPIGKRVKKYSPANSHHHCIIIFIPNVNI